MSNVTVSFEDWKDFDALSFALGVSQPGSVPPNVPRKAVPTDCVFTREVDNDSAVFMEYFVKGKPFETVTVTISKESHSTTMELQKVLISGYLPPADRGAAVPIEEVGLDFESMELSFE